MGAFLLVFASTLLTIDLYGASIPFYDEWEAEAFWLYKLYAEGNLDFSNLFEPHNGHRIFFTRVTALLLFILNGGWDPQLQLIISAILHALTGATLVHLVRQQVKLEHQRWAILATVVLFSVPFSWLSILVAFQTQFYFMIFFAIISMSMLSISRYFSGYIFALLSMLSMTSGAFVLPAFIAAILLESFGNRTISKSQVMHITISGVAFCIFLATRAPDPGAIVYYAQHLKGFVITILATVSWPFRVSYGIGLIIYMPLCLLLVRACFRTRVPRVYLCLLIFMFLQILSMGYFRGGEGVPPANRYWEIMIIGIWLNGMAAIYLVENSSNKTLKMAIIFWGVVTVIGLTSLANTALSNGLPERKQQSLTAQALLLQYLFNGDATVFEGRSGFDISHPNSEELVAILSNPTVQYILPSSLGGGFYGQAKEC